MPTRIIIGLMSGTSVDSIDAAIVEIRGRAPRLSVKLLHHYQANWPPQLRRRLLAAMAPAPSSAAEICELNFLTAGAFAAAVRSALQQAGVAPHRVSAVASHGQTVCHLPPRPGRRTGSTLQLGDVAVIATLTGIPTIGNFRSADMAVGGHGAPLVPWADAILLRDVKRARAIQNIGGIANVTYLPPGQGFSAVRAFDTGPGNMAIDALISIATGGRQRCDTNGHIARQGRVDDRLFAQLQAHRYFSLPPPKSTGREVFGTAFVEKILAGADGKSICDLTATLTALTAWSITDAYHRFLPRVPEEVIICGGGLHNAELIRYLAADLAKLGCRNVIPMDQLGIVNKAREAMAFAMLGAAALDGVPANLPQVTGAAKPMLLGVVAQGPDRTYKNTASRA
ncbi:MAG: anhydro-N-acetylmuramic acid kinase [Phycisphaerae bacterium]|nr:anhydro-N-acetylmuramic acid kinase [Phycisphaerae bacterium]